MGLTKATGKVISDNLDISGIATATNFKTGSTNVHSVGVEAAGINVLGADTPIGTGSTIYDDGGARFSGIVSTTSSHVGGATTFAEGLVVTGNARVTGILTVGTGSIIIDSADDSLSLGQTKFKRDSSSGDLEIVDRAGSRKGIRANELFIGGNRVLDSSRNALSGLKIPATLVTSGKLDAARLPNAIPNATFTGVTTFSAKVDVSDGTLELPSGNSLQRSAFANVGDFRYNTTTGKVELYNGSAWENIGNSQPLVNNISPTSFNGLAGSVITIVGQNFVSGANVHFVSSVNGSSTAAGSVAFTNSGILTATTPALAVAGEPYGVKVTNPDGGMTLLEAALDAGSAPAFTTPAGSLGTGIQKGSTISGIAVTATDADGQSVTYSEVTSVLTSNANTPAATMNLTLNSSTGVISGTAPNVSSDTTYNFTIRASDGTNTTDRNFSLGIMAASDPVYWFRGSAHGGTGNSDQSVSGGYFTTGNNHRSSGGGNANNDRLYVYKSGSSRTGVGIHQYLSSNNSATIPADHNKFKVVVSSYSTSSHSSHYGWGGAATGNNSRYTFSRSGTGTGTFIDDIPATMPGNAYHFTIGTNCGQNCNNQIQVTLAVSYNSENPP